MFSPIPFVVSPQLMRGLAAATAAGLIVALAAPSSADAQNRSQHSASAQAKPRVIWKAPATRRAVVRPRATGTRVVAVAPRRRTVGRISVYRPYGPTIYGYGFHYTDVAAARWIGLTAITIRTLDLLEEDQIRYHEQAQIEATTAPIGEAIVWEDNGASGAVTSLREGVDANGYTCREFQQVVTISGQQETAFGTACLQSDGSWKIVE